MLVQYSVRDRLNTTALVSSSIAINLNVGVHWLKGAMSDQEYDDGNSPVSVEPPTTEVSDQEVEEQATNSNIADDDTDVNQESKDHQLSVESPSQAETSLPQNLPSTFQLGSQENQEDVFAADSDSDVEISAAIEAVTRDEDSPPVKQKRRFLSDSDEEENVAQRNDSSPPPAKKNKVEGEEYHTDLKWLR